MAARIARTLTSAATPALRGSLAARAPALRTTARWSHSSSSGSGGSRFFSWQFGALAGGAALLGGAAALAQEAYCKAEEKDEKEWAEFMALFGGEGKPKKIIISGAPASGKGTQCEFLVEKFGVVHISTGDALRAQVKAGTELGKKAKSFMDSGGLVPDDVMIGIVNSRLAEKDCVEKGWLLDGFPRTAAQAEAIKKGGHEADKFIILNVPDDILIERCVGRRTDPVTGKIYHMKFNKPPSDPEVQKRLVHRSDDTAEAMTQRLKQYHKNVAAVKGYYKDITKEFNGVGDKMKIAADLAEFVAE